MNDTQRGIILLLKAALSGEKQELPDGFCLEDAYEIAKKQGLLTLFYQGAVTCGISRDMPIMQQMLKIYYKQLLHSERQMRAVDRIFQAFEENGIDYMPLKGCNMKRLYPQPELRIMGDADILIREEQTDRIKPLMEGIGFQLKSEDDHVFNWLSDDLYVELHKSVVPVTDPDYLNYYGTGWRLAVKGEGFRHDMTVEDSFVFIFTHFARHYRSGGIGCRQIVDLYVYRSKYPEMDEKHIRQELEKLRLLDFYENVLHMLDVWFRDGVADEVTELITAFVFSGGSWGSMRASVYSKEVRSAAKHGSVKHAKFKAAVRMLFPSRISLTYRYTVLRKAPWLLPVIWVVRWFDVLLFRPKKIRKRMKVAGTVNDDSIQAYKQSLNKVGLDFHFDR